MRVCLSPPMEVEHGAPGFHRPARRFVSARDALQIHTVLIEVQILFVPANCADQSLKGIHTPL